jgi:V-type H+-transporting ATPase subunit a
LNKLRRHRSLSYGYLWSPLSRDAFMEAFFGPEPEKGILDLSESDARNFKLNLEQIPFRKIAPPTYFKTNEFTAVFQLITDTYGVPTYKEINPSIFGCVTFPFLFGMMFGDMGHGGLLFIFSAGLVLAEPWLRQGPLQGALSLRYILLLMGFFAFYCGFMYNDFVSIPIHFWDSCYSFETGKKLPGNQECIYPAGMDPIWKQTKQEITFSNSLKMKMAVIYGVAHMTLAIFQKGLNSLYWRRYLDFFFEFIPQLVLLLALFGYMDLIIIKKWVTDYSGVEHEAPSIITTMVNIFLGGGKVPGREFFAGN